MKLVRLIKMCLNETIVKSTETNICISFPIQNGLKQGDVLSPLLFNFTTTVQALPTKLPKLQCSGQSSWLQIQGSGFNSRCYQIF
jgi:hypothetical protein